MTLLAPIAGIVAAAVTLPLLVMLYFLKLRRQTVDVSSIMLWRRAVQDLQVNAPFQRLRRNLLLLLQVLMLLALLIAFARPAFQQTGPPGQRIVILIDRSAAMNATDVSPSRLAEAKRVAQRLIEDMPDLGIAPGSAGAGQSEAEKTSGGRSGGGGGGGVMVIAFGLHAKVIEPFTSDPALLRAAVDSIQPSDERAQIGEALRLITPFANQGAAHPLTVYLLSDGRVGDTAGLALPGADVKFVRIPGNAGENASPPGPLSSDNLAIVDLAARRDPKQPTTVHLFARLANYGPHRVDTHLTIRVDGQTNRVVDTFVPPAPESPGGSGEPGSQSLEFSVEIPGGALLELSHDHADVLPDDDHAALVITPPRQLHALLVTGPGSASGVLQQAIRAVGVERLDAVSGAEYERQEARQLRAAGFDVIVFDQYAPQSTPALPTLSFGAVPPFPGMDVAIRPTPVSGVAHAQPVLDWRRNDPLLRFVEFDSVTLSDPGHLVLPDSAVVLATCQDGPVMAEVSVDGVRHVFTSFALDHARTWTMQMSFPVFMANALPYLGLGGQAGVAVSYHAGEAAIVPTTATQVEFTGPADLLASAARGHAVLPVFPLAGVYRATGSSHVEQPWDRLPVNVGDAQASDTRPVDQIHIGQDKAATMTTTQATRREAWRWFVWLALAALLVEWVIYTRRMHV